MRGSVRPILRDGQKQYSKRTGEPLWRLVYDTGHPGEKRKQRVTSFTGTRKSAEAKLRRLIDEFKNSTDRPKQYDSRCDAGLLAQRDNADLPW